MKKYNLIGSKSTFRITYKRGLVGKIEHISGVNNADQWKGVLGVLPATEENIMEIPGYYPSIRVDAITTQSQAQSQYKHYVSDWFLFYYTINDIEPKFTGTDGKCIRSIMKHFEQVSKTPEDARASWQMLLKKWENLPEFYRKKTDLAFINAKLNEIITQLKDTDNGKKQADTFREAAK